MYAIILAAGKGTRMKSDLPKVLMPFANTTLIEPALNNLQNANLEAEPLVVVGYQAEKVQQHLAGHPITFVHQEEQKGTGHAVQVCKDHIDKSRPVLVLYGDHVLIKPKTLKRLNDSFSKGKAVMSMVTYRIPDYEIFNGQFKSYGRILRDEDENMIGIREKKDANEDELSITEVNPAYFLFDGPWLWENLEKLNANNAQSELYLTDLVEMAINQGKFVDTVLGDDLVEAIGVNTQDQLRLAEQLLQKR